MEREHGWYVVRVEDTFRGKSTLEVACWNGWWQLAGGDEDQRVIEVVSGKLDLATLMNKD